MFDFDAARVCFYGVVPVDLCRRFLSVVPAAQLAELVKIELGGDRARRARLFRGRFKFGSGFSTRLVGPHFL